MDSKPILVVGAGGALGMEIVRVLSGRGQSVIATYRTEKPGLIEQFKALGADHRRLDLADRAGLTDLASNVSAAIFTPILTISHCAAELLSSNQRAVFFSSNNVAIDPEAEVYASIIEAEHTIQSLKKSVSILRPTMIYGYPEDGNIHRLARHMRRFPLTPMPGSGDALQQPIFYQDLARIAVSALFNASPSNQILHCAGPEPLSKRALYDQVKAASGAKTMITPIRTTLLRGPLSLLERIGIKSPLNPTQVARADRDKLPASGNVQLGTTTFAEGAKALMSALDEALDGA